jgi:hypothetical protein
VNVPVVVYLAVHDRGGYRPPAGWEKTDRTLKWYLCTDTVYRKPFGAGVVEIPGHDGMSGGNYGIPHTAFVAGNAVKIAAVND